MEQLVTVIHGVGSTGGALVSVARKEKRHSFQRAETSQRHGNSERQYHV